MVMLRASLCQLTRGALAAWLAGCGGYGVAAHSISAESPLRGTSNVVRTQVSGRCSVFGSAFDELVACQRADGTIASFSARKVKWRVRYYVRYWEMPCHEEPTVQEAYVFHMVTNDLYNDADLDDGERSAIRTAIYDGREHCR